MNGIEWMNWGNEAFARAKSENKPVLLSISAVWCHWCHVMDDSTYTDEGVIQAINRDYVAVRVDNDERPDVNARYNMGGWPTTAFLTPDGTTLTGATYLPAAQMLRALADVARFYSEKQSEIESRVAELREAKYTYEPQSPDILSSEMPATITEAIRSSYDREFGGFGDAPKFPQPEVLDFVLTEWRVTNDPELYEIVARTMLEMARGGMYDHVEGGFFRYSTTRDWSVPHFEKMSEDHAGLLHILADLHIFAPTQATRDTLRSALAYVRTVLRNRENGLFAGSQDADEAYFALPLEERRTREAPFVDRRSYANWSAALAGAFAWCALALDDDSLASEAMQALDTLHDVLRDEDGLLHHVLPPDGAPRVRGLLADQVAYLRALLDVHEVTGEQRYLERAREHADRTIAHFEAQDGGFYDHARREAMLGRLEVADRPIVDNGVMAENLLRLSIMTADAAYRAAAERILTLYAKTFANAGSFAATYARALRRYLSPEVSVRIEGPSDATEEMREAARRLPAPFVTVFSRPSPAQAQAFVCVGTTCAQPVASAAELREAFDAVSAPV